MRKNILDFPFSTKNKTVNVLRYKYEAWPICVPRPTVEGGYPRWPLVPVAPLFFLCNGSVQIQKRQNVWLPVADHFTSSSLGTCRETGVTSPRYFTFEHVHRKDQFFQANDRTVPVSVPEFRHFVCGVDVRVTSLKKNVFSFLRDAMVRTWNDITIPEQYKNSPTIP